MEEKLKHNELLKLYRNTPLTILKQIYQDMFDMNKLTCNQMANLLATLKLRPSDEKLNDLHLEYEITTQKYHQQLFEQQLKLKNETLDKLKLTMKVKVEEIPLADYAWKNVKDSLWFLNWKSIGEMDVVEIDESTGNIVIKRDYGKYGHCEQKLMYSQTFWFSGDRLRAELI